MPQITFKAKAEAIWNPEGDAIAYRLIKVPAIKRSHCDMAAFRSHKRFGSYANSDLFPNMLARALKEAGIGTHIRLDSLPACVTVDDSGFLHRVTINLP